MIMLIINNSNEKGGLKNSESDIHKKEKVLW
jgi:hypothetical protein